MKLCVVRHAIAAEAAEGQRDSARPLTKQGKRKFELVVKALKLLGVEFELVVHSPLLRAVETAELMRGLLEGEMRVTSRMAEPPSKALLGMFEAERVAAVGHEPYVSELTAWLVTGDRQLARAFPFKKGGVALLEGAPKPGEMFVTGFLSPAQLRAIARRK